MDEVNKCINANNDIYVAKGGAGGRAVVSMIWHDSCLLILPAAGKSNENATADSRTAAILVKI